MKLEDIKLVTKCQKGDKKAFKSLISKYYPFVYKFLIKLTEDENLAQDLTQETFLNLIRHIEKYNTYGKAKFSTYLITISKNCYIDELRKSRKIEVNFDSNEYIASLISDNNQEEKIINKLYAKSISKELENLTENQKVAIKLKYIEGLTLKEISELLDVEPKTIKSRIHNGITKVRRLLNKRGEYFE